MPYKIRKQKCKQSGGDSGTYVLSYTDKKGKKHRNCHTSKKKAQGQIAAIEMEGVEPVESIHDLLREDASVPNRVRIEYTREDIEQFLESLLNEGTLKPPKELVDAMTQWTNEQLFDSVTPYINRAIKGCEEVLKLFRSLPDYPGDKNSGVVTRYFESGATVDKVGFYELLINDDLTYGGSPDHAIETYADTLRQLQDLRKWLDSLGSSSTRRTPQHKQSYRSKELVTAPAGAPDMDEAVAAAIYDAFMRAEPRYTKSLPKDYATALGTFNDLIMDTMSIIEGLGQYGAKIPPKKGIILSMVRLLQAIPTRLEAGAVVVPHGAPSKHGDFSPAGGSYRVRTFMREYLHPDRIKARMKEARASMRDYAGYTRQYADQTPPKYGLALNGAGKPIPPPTEKMAQLAGELALVNYLIARGGIDMRYLEDEIKDMLSRSSGVAKHELTHAMQAFGSTLIAMSRIADVLGTVRDRAKDLGLSVADLSSSEAYEDRDLRRAAIKLISTIVKSSNWAEDVPYGGPPKKARQPGLQSGTQARSGSQHAAYRLTDVEHQPFLHTALEQVNVEYQKHGDLKRAVRDAVMVHWDWIRRSFQEVDPEIRSADALQVKLRHFARELYKAAQEELGEQ